MRDIRFRQWDGTRNKFYFGIGIARDGGFNSPPMVNWDRYPMDQYTGLKDKNGVEIYEGDLVRMTTKVTLDTIRTGTVFEDEVAFNNGRFYVKGEASYFAIGDRFESDIEVIGNIHENPELLK